MDPLTDIHDFFKNCFTEHGESAEGVGWNSDAAQQIRFDQLLKVVNAEKPFSLIEYGCGYGQLIHHLDSLRLQPEHYYGVDIVEESLAAARGQFANRGNVSFHQALAEIPAADYLVASGVFNVKLNHDNSSWTGYVIESLHQFDRAAGAGFAVNFLTIYSDYDRMAQRPDLYYADPLFLFDYCKQNFSKNVALLHDYELYDFTLIVRK